MGLLEDWFGEAWDQVTFKIGAGHPWHCSMFEAVRSGSSNHHAYVHLCESVAQILIAFDKLNALPVPC